MRIYAASFLAVTALPSAASSSITLVTFDGTPSTTHRFSETNDPVMGGRSTGTFSVENGLGVFDGQVVDVPSLRAPGFIKADADMGEFPDISSCSSIVIEANTSAPYDGYRLSFGTKRALGCSFFSSGYKAHFDAPVSGKFENITIPLTAFSDCTSDATGEPTRNCTDDKNVCPDDRTLRNIETLGVWGEGALGKVHLEIKSISADGCTAEGSETENPMEINSNDVALVTFDGASGTTHHFVTLNDPVMGGQSNGTFQVVDNVGVFEGNVNIVPKLKAPGFLEVWADDGNFVDVSAAASGSLVLTVRSSTPDYAGYRVSFAAGAPSPTFSCAAGGSIIGSKGCYKADFAVLSGDDFVEVEVPFSSFSDEWSSFTGEPTTRCVDDSRVCPTAEGLKKIQAVGVWAEGKEGPIHLEIKSIAARPATSPQEVVDDTTAPRGLSAAVKANAAQRSTTRPPHEYDICSGGVQDNLRYNMSQFNTPVGVPVNVSATESLATAICCDSRTKVFAEPRSLFLSPTVNLFGELSNTSGPTTFYDSVCGIPLFRAPINRTFEDFQAESVSHGWPSFRKEELVGENVVTDKNGFVYSKCGTHLGSYLPDDKGDRWCLDLSCLSGNPTTSDSSRRLRGKQAWL